MATDTTSGHAASGAGVRSASDDDGVVRGRFCERCQVPGITGQDPIAWAGQQDDGYVNRIAGASYAQQDTGLAAVLGTHRADIHRAQQLRQAGLAAMTVAPDLGDNHGVAAQVHAMLLGDAQPGDHGTVAAVDGNQCACVQDQCAHAALSLAAMPSSRSARASSPAVSTPCSASHPSRNSASASARSLAAAASASQDDKGLPAWAAADRTASPSSGSNETLSLSTFTSAMLPR